MQCGVYINKESGMRVGNTWEDKKNNVDKYGTIGANGIKTGDVIYQNTGTPYGHVAKVEEVLPNGNVIVSESNWNNDEKVTYGREVASNNIYGYIDPNSDKAKNLKI